MKIVILNIFLRSKNGLLKNKHEGTVSVYTTHTQLCYNVDLSVRQTVVGINRNQSTFPERKIHTNLSTNNCLIFHKKLFT